MRWKSFSFTMMLGIGLSLQALAQVPASSGGVAEAVKSDGDVRVINAGVQQKIQVNQRFQTGDILKLKAGAVLEVAYDNGCSEVFSQVSDVKIDACACLTSSFRKGKVDNYNATLQNVNGEVLVYQGDKYRPAKSGTRVRDGDRVMAMREGSARVQYDHGCVKSVESFTIHDVNGCKACPLPVEQPLRQAVQPVQPTPTAASPFNDPNFWKSVGAVTFFALRIRPFEERPASP